MSTPLKKNGSIVFTHPLIGAAILFGMWVCYVSSLSEPMPYAVLEPFKTLGLYIFRTEFNLACVFWFAFVAHVFEGLYAASLAYDVSTHGRIGRKVNVGFILFWLVQTFLFGYPSLMHIQKQRQEQLARKK